MPSLAERLKLPKLGFKKEDVRDDVGAAVVLGVESVPDGLASGLLAGVNPVAGLYAYMFGVASAALFTSTAFMAVQGTGAMAIIVNDVDIDGTDDPTRTLVTLSILTGVVMIVAGYFKLGQQMKFVSNSVMTGFISAVGLNIVLGQFGDFTGYDSDGSNRVTSAFDTILHPWRMDVWTVLVGASTIVLIVLLRRTKLGAMGMVVAIAAGSALAAVVRALDREIDLVGNVAEVPTRLPAPTLPAFGEIAMLIIPALSLAFVGLVQGAGVSAAFANPDGTPGDTDKDFVGQGVGNVGAAVFQGMPVGGSMSASSLITSGGAKSRWSLIYTAVVMGIVILLFAGVVEYIAMPALAGLLIVVGIETIKPHDILGVYKTGSVPAIVMAVTFVLTLVIPLQFAVLVGVGMSMLLYIVTQSNELDTRRLVVRDDGGIDEVDPPDKVLAHDVVVLQPYGSLFFATAPILEEQLPTVTDDSGGSVVILRFRGKPDIGSTLLDILETYSVSLDQVGSKLMIVTDSDRIINQLDRTGAIEQIGNENVYRGGTRLLGTVIQASSDAQDWVTTQLGRDDTGIEETPIDNLTMGDLPTDATLAMPGGHEQADRTDDAADGEDQGTSDSDET
jgi:SulP family sulfate permease